MLRLLPFRGQDKASITLKPYPDAFLICIQDWEKGPNRQGGAILAVKVWAEADLCQRVCVFPTLRGSNNVAKNTRGTR
jgi:hypothetical protein